MAKKKKKNKHKHRNALPRAARTSRASADETPLRRLAYTAAGAGGTALVGSLLARQGWAPKTIAGAMAAVGGGLAWKGEGSTIRSVGAGAMSAAGSQLALMMIDDRDQQAPVKKPKNADGLPPGALEAAFERARSRLQLTGDELPEHVAA